MTKAEIIEIVAKKAHLTKKAARESIDAFLDETIRQINKGEKVVLSGFGTFKVRSKNSRIGRNPKTGVEAKITARKVVTYHVSDKIKFKLNP